MEMLAATGNDIDSRTRSSHNMTLTAGPSEAREDIVRNASRGHTEGEEHDQ